MFVNYSMYKLLPILLFAYGLAVTTDEIYDNSYALIIGIDKYENVSNLDYAVKDANSVASLLKDNFNFPAENVKILLNDEATLTNFKNSLEEISLSAKVNDRVLIYFAGHGETMDLTEGGERGYLLPVDGNKEDLYLSSIGMDELEDISEMSKAKHTLYLVDACYGGIAAVGSRGLDASSTPNYIEKITRNRGVQIITAGSRGEQVIEKPKWGHSAFTMNLIRGLKDRNADFNTDGYITANELGMFLSEKVTIDSENQQTPQYGRMTSQEGEFVFVYSENTTVVQDKSTDKEEALSDKASSSYWSKRYSITMKGTEIPELYGVHALVLEDNNKGITFFTTLGSEWTVSISFLSIKKSILNESLQEFQPGSANITSVTINHALYRINERAIWVEGLFGMAYTAFTVPDKSNTYNKIFPHLGVHLGLRPLPSAIPALLLGLNVSVSAIPNSYNETDEVIQLDDWNIQLFPAFAIGFVIPKDIFFPK